MAATARRPGTRVPEIRKGDTVVVLSGKDAGKRGTVERVIRVSAAASPRKSLYRNAEVRVVIPSLRRKPESRTPGAWIPACAGMTTREAPALWAGNLPRTSGLPH